MRPRCIAGPPHHGNYLSLLHFLPHGDIQPGIMPVNRLPAVVVINANHVAVTADPARNGNGTGKNGLDGRTGRSGQVQAVMETAPAGAETGSDTPTDWPNEGGSAKRLPPVAGAGSNHPAVSGGGGALRRAGYRDVQNLAGKDAVFTVTVKEIKRKELAPLDDEFAKDVSEFDSMQELRNDIANKLKEAAEKKAENQLRLAAVKKVSENTQVEIPQAMIDNRVNQMINDFAYHLATQGITLEKYLEGTNTKIEDIKAYYEGEARSTVKADLVLEAVAKAEGIKATAEDVEKQIKRMAEQYKQEPEKIREALEKQGQLSGLEFGIMLDKAVDFVVEHAKVEIVPAQTAEAAGAPKESNAGETEAPKEKAAK